MQERSTVPAPRLRRMEARDLPALLDIQLACYGAGFIEGAALLERRLAAAPLTAWVAEQRGERDDESPNRVIAYLTGYPSVQGKLTALNGDFEPADQPDTLYLHDLAVHPRAHGLRLGPRLVTHALTFGSNSGWHHAALVSVQDSLGFWQRHGFAATTLAQSEQAVRLATYPGPAVYMTRRVPTGASA